MFFCLFVCLFVFFFFGGGGGVVSVCGCVCVCGGGGYQQIPAMEGCFSLCRGLCLIPDDLPDLSKDKTFFLKMRDSCFLSSVKLQYSIFIRPPSDGTYYGMVMSVRPTLRPSVRPGLRSPVFHTFLIHALTY